MQSSAIETMHRISRQQGVKCVVVTTKEGAVIETIGATDIAELCAHLVPRLSDMARNVVRDLDPTNDLDFLRIRSKKHEIMAAADVEFNLVVVQEVA